MPHISLAAETLTRLWGIPISNSFLTTYVVMGLLILGSFMATRRLLMIPGNVQIIVEILIGGLYDFFSSVTGKHIREFFPLLATIFIFVIASNWIGLLPGVGTIGFFHEKSRDTVFGPTGSLLEPKFSAATTPSENREVSSSPKKKENTAEETDREFTPLFRGPTADLNTTLALALVSVLSIQFYGFKLAGLHYSTRFFNFSNPILFGVGLLELASEISKIISFAFRLFGNIFAGEVLLAVIAYLIPVVVPLPFLTLELFVGFIQALVFSMLTAVFLNVAVSHGEEHGKEVRAHG